MRVVVYGDILFVLNAYVTYTLLLVTDFLCREHGSRLRRTLAALLGGGYAFLIFIPRLPGFVLPLSRLAAAAVFVLVAYGKSGRKRFFLRYGSFFLVNFVFAGLMLALWITVKPRSMLLFGSVVYFNISTLLLVVMTAVCYAAFYVLHLVLNARKPRRSLLRLTVSLDGRSVSCSALSDSGNSLTEPFSGLPVILMRRQRLLPLLADADLNDTETAARLHVRRIPCRTAAGEAVLAAFQPDEITVRTEQSSLRTGDVYIAVCDAPFDGGAFDALLHPNLTEEMNVIV